LVSADWKANNGKQSYECNQRSPKQGSNRDWRRQRHRPRESRVSRVVSAIDAGRILNPLAARNQIEGAVVMGIGMALFEHTTYDPQNGAPINGNLADYVVAGNSDAPPIDVHFMDYPDKEINELGARGIGEIGLAGIAAAITAAVHHATGVRVRELPVKIEDLLV
jgi:xanthine dehydrogenase YagR molybdenum-binding subunit